MKRSQTILAAIAAGAVVAGCHTDMWVQPKIHEPFQPSTFYKDEMSSRPLVQGTVARGHLRLDV